MVYSIKVPLQQAEEAKRYLITQKNLNYRYKIYRNKKFIYFPLIEKDKIMKYVIVSKQFKLSTTHNGNLREKLTSKLTKKEQALLKTAFDIIGNIAILDIPNELRHKEKIIAHVLLKSNHQVITVLRKEGTHTGIFRTQKLKWLAGKKIKETIYKEHGVVLHLHVEKVYFSPRISTERKRIYQQVKKGESILVMFSGCAPYPCVIAKNTKAKEIYGVEINPEAHRYGLENLQLNKLDNVKLFLGDVRTIVPSLHKKFDRVIMPLPKSAEDFLDVAIHVIKKEGMIHFYDFLHENDFNLVNEKVKKACYFYGKKCRIVKLVKCGHYSPQTYRICVDVVIK